MKRILVNLIVVKSLLFSGSVFGISKQDSLNQDKPIIDKQTMLDAGTWDLYMTTCAGKARKEFIEKLGKLSWPDLKLYHQGGAKFDQGWSASCQSSETKKGQGFYNWIIQTLEKELKNNTSNNSSTKKRNALIYCQKSNGNVYTSIHGTCVPDKKISKEEYLEIKNENKIKKEQNEDIETKLMKLKSLFEKKLITKEEYDQKRKEILDEM